MSRRTLDPAQMEGPAGARLRIVNWGEVRPDWAIPDLKVKSRELAHGESEEISFRLPQQVGKHRIECTVPGHAQHGMVGELTVQSSP